jgi:hypothetical protein
VSEVSAPSARQAHPGAILPAVTPIELHRAGVGYPIATLHAASDRGPGRGHLPAPGRQRELTGSVDTLFESPTTPGHGGLSLSPARRQPGVLSAYGHVGVWSLTARQLRRSLAGLPFGNPAPRQVALMRRRSHRRGSSRAPPDCPHCIGLG